MPSQQGSSSSYYQEQFRHPSDEELFLTLKEDIKRDNEALQMRFPIMETEVDATMIADMGTNAKDLNREMYVIMERMARQAEELEKIQKEQSSRHLLSDTKKDDIRENENITLSLEDESPSPTLDEDKDIMECDKTTLVLEGELKNPTLVEKNELAIDEEPLLKEKQVEKQHLKLIMENVLIGVEDFYFSIESLTFGMEEDQQVSWEMTLFVGEEKMKFDLHQRTPLTDEESRAFKKLESSFPLIEEQAPKIL